MNDVIDIAKLHLLALILQRLLEGEQHAQTGRGNVVELFTVQLQLGDAVEHRLHFLLEFRRGIGVQAPVQRDVEDAVFELLRDIEHGVSLLKMTDL